MSTLKHWQQIKAIFYSAQECAPADRASFLNSACGDDEAMRQEVESLLAAHETNEDFLGTPAYELMAGVLANQKTEFVAGQEVGPYTILSSLGTGGMGQVYLAQDSRLPRKVALKVLSVDVARDERRVQLFEHEAQAASRLNHPNVCMILEIGTAPDGRRFIAMEHIDGLTLRDLIEQRRLAPAEALDLAIQVAAALAAAHAAGIVHRDIKPENIMLRPDGYIKVLDFGIAKLSESLPRLGETDAASTTRLSTEPGMLMGTVRYMSPEQLREAPVDQRTDIWSLGVVIHEMLTGATPFEAETPNDTIALILGKQSTEFNFADKLSVEFQQLLKKALAKDRTERYQTVKELAADLKKARREFHRQTEIDGTAERVSQEPLFREPPDSSEWPRSIDPIRTTILFRLKSQAVSTSDFLLSEIKKHKTTAVFTGITAIFAVLLLVPNLAGLSGWINRFRAPPQTTYTFTNLSPVTNSGTSVCAAISPDGKSVAHVEKKDGKQQLVIAGPSGNSVVVPLDDVDYHGLTFSPDGYYLYFTRIEKSEFGILYQLALADGSLRRIKDRVDSPITFSPAGDRFAFVRSDVSQGEYLLIIAGIDGTGESVVAKRGNGARFSVDGPSWSPDGKTIVCGAGSWDKGYRMNLIEVSLDGEQKVVGDRSWYFVYQVAWLEDGSGLIISAREQAMGPSHLWMISYPQGQPVQITRDPTADYRGVSLSRDTNEIVSVQSQRRTTIFTVPSWDARRAKKVVPITGLAFGLDWTANGKIVYSSMARDHLNISLVDPDGSNNTQLTVDAGDNYTPATSPDGRFIVFSSNRTGHLNIWRMNAEDGSNLKQLTSVDGDSYPSCSADSQWVFYDNQSDSPTTVWKVPIDGGNPMRLTSEYARMPVVSPDNQVMACRYFLENDAQKKIAIIPVEGGLPVKLLPIPVRNFQKVQWISNGRALTYIDIAEGVSNIKSYNLDNGSTKQLTRFQDDEQIFAYAWSAGNRQLACQRGAEDNNVIKIGNQK